MNKLRQLQALDFMTESQHMLRQDVCFFEAIEEAANDPGEEQKPVIVVANPSYILVIPRFGEMQTLLQRIDSISRGMAVFSKRELDWRVDIKFKLDFEHTLLQSMEDVLSQDGACAFAYVFVNGGFQKRYFPGVLSELQNTESLNINRTYAERLFNPKTHVIAKSFGQQSLANLLIHFDRGGSMCSCFDGHLDVIGIGRGDSKDKLLMGAIYEYLERRVSAELPKQLLHTPLAASDKKLLAPNDIFGSLPEQNGIYFPQYSASSPIHWMPAKDLSSDREVWIPAAMVCYLDEKLPKVSFNTNSNGCALGNSTLEAVYYALLEVIERDALLLTWYTQSSPVRIVLDNTVPANVHALVKMIECQGYKVHIFDISTDINVPVVLSVLEGLATDKMAAFVTAGAHTDPGIALENAVSEAYSLFSLCERNYLNKRSTLANNNRSNTEQYFEYADPKNKARFDFLLNTPLQMMASHFMDTHKRTVSDDLFDGLVQKVRAAGYQPLFAENTPSYLRDLGLHWVRAYVPELINLVFGDRPIFVSPHRVAKASQQKAWIRNVEVASQPVLHPLG